MKSIILFVLITLCFESKVCQAQPDTLLFNSEESKVQGYFYNSNIPKAPILIFTQGFFENEDIWNIGSTLAANGINLFAFDFRGCFDSEGEQGLINSQKDIEAAILFIKSKEMMTKYEIDTTNIIVGGYSYGGHMSLLYAVNHPQIKRVISVSGGDLGIFADIVKSNEKLKKGYSDFFQSIKKPNGPVEFAYENPIDELLQNQEYFYILHQINKLSGIDILMTGGLDDSVVDMEHYILPLYRELKKIKSVSLKTLIYQTNHSYKNVRDVLLDDIISWIRK